MARVFRYALEGSGMLVPEAVQTQLGAVLTPA
jgi:hypothetical protein